METHNEGQGELLTVEGGQIGVEEKWTDHGTGRRNTGVEKDKPMATRVSTETDKARIANNPPDRTMEAVDPLDTTRGDLEACNQMASKRWAASLHETGGHEEWLAQPGSVADVHRPLSPTGVDDITHSETHEEWFNTNICITRTVGIEHEKTIIVCRMIQKGVMADRGANAYMANSEAHLVGCHNI
jgi:hypothetical protein